jgi:hypothetical protein
VNENLPYRFRESTFRLYEGCIIDILSNWPDATGFKPANVETFRCRLRDSVRSILDHNWPSEIDLKKLFEISPLYQVSIMKETVWVGTKEAIQRANGMFSQRTPVAEHNIINNPSPEAIEAIMVLHHQRVFDRPTLIRMDTPYDMKQWEVKYDVAIDGPDVNNIWTIL